MIQTPDNLLLLSCRHTEAACLAPDVCVVILNNVPAPIQASQKIFSQNMQLANTPHSIALSGGCVDHQFTDMQQHASYAWPAIKNGFFHASLLCMKVIAS